MQSAARSSSLSLPRLACPLQRAGWALLACLALSVDSAAQQRNSSEAALVVGHVDGPPWPIVLPIEAEERGVALTLELTGVPGGNYLLFQAPGRLLRAGFPTDHGLLDLAPSLRLAASGRLDGAGRVEVSVPADLVLAGWEFALQGAVSSPTSPTRFTLTAATGFRFLVQPLQREFFVSHSRGAPGNAGTRAKPFSTLAGGLAAASAGTRLIVEAGSYSEPAGFAFLEGVDVLGGYDARTWQSIPDARSIIDVGVEGARAEDIQLRPTRIRAISIVAQDEVDTGKPSIALSIKNCADVLRFVDCSFQAGDSLAPGAQGLPGSSGALGSMGTNGISGGSGGAGLPDGGGDGGMGVIASPGEDGSPGAGVGGGGGGLGGQSAFCSLADPGQPGRAGATGANGASGAPQAWGGLVEFSDWANGVGATGAPGSGGAGGGGGGAGGGVVCNLSFGGFGGGGGGGGGGGTGGFGGQNGGASIAVFSFSNTCVFEACHFESGAGGPGGRGGNGGPGGLGGVPGFGFVSPDTSGGRGADGGQGGQGGSGGGGGGGHGGPSHGIYFAGAGLPSIASGTFLIGPGGSPGLGGSPGGQAGQSGESSNSN